MPYQSDAQRKFFNANRSKLEKQGVDVDEWNHATKDKHLPEHVHHEHANAPYRLAREVRNKET